MRSRSMLPPALAVTLSAVLLVGCGSSDEPKTDAAPAPPEYATDSGVSVRVLPQIAQPGEETAAADDAAWVVEAQVKGAEAGQAVELFALVDNEWDAVDEAETDEEGRVSLTSQAGGELHVITDLSEGDVGNAASTDDAVEVSFEDEFDENSVDGPGLAWGTRSQGYAGVRMCSKADAQAVEVDEGVLRLSVLDDPDAEKCTVKGEQYDYRLNGHVSTQHSYSFTYGFAAARLKFQPDRGQHGAFWMQTPGGPAGESQREAGAEIDVVEYFGDDHPQGGLTSFTYWFDPNGKKSTDGGWIENAEQYGEDWAERFHVFSVEWTPEEYVFRIDGQVTHRLTGETSAQAEFLILSLLSSDYELKHSSELPQSMDVDWVRTWETSAG